ncbi:MAG: hypothetical protein MJK07_06040 [Flavobacteriales bacterium]|nr:hypothetical protein [Flavobacteriales bacterium]
MSWNSPPSNQMDAAEGWDAYKGTNIGADTPVIGTLDDTSLFKNKSGYNVLDSNRWSPGVNKSWVQGGVDSGKISGYSKWTKKRYANSIR